MSAPTTFFAKIISYIFHPLLLPTFGLFLIFHLNDGGLWVPRPQMQWILLVFTFSLTGLLPLLTALFLYQSKQISSLEMQTKEERKLPYMALAVFYSCESYLLMRLEVPALVQEFIFGATILVISALIINMFWKISAHMLGIGGLTGLMIAISSRLQIDIHLILVALFLIAGLVAFSRLKLDAHNPAQVYTGFLLGVVAQLILFL
jgi:hypothetical protein